MNRVLVIGGSGFIGSHLVERLSHKGYKVTVLVRKTSDIRLLKSLGVGLGYGDLLEPDSLKEALSGVETVFCVVNVKPGGKSPQEYEKQLYQVHINGTKNLIEACRVNKVKRVIYFSSVAAMGYKKGISFYDESFKEIPVDAYGKAKLEAENILNSYSKNREIDLTILRPPGVFGERGLGPFKKIIFCVERRLVPIIGSGENKQSLIYVGNLVNEAIFLSENALSIGKTYITSEERPYSVNELVEVVAEVMDIHPFKIHIPTKLVMYCASGLNFLTGIFLKRAIINPEGIIAISSERIFDGSRLFRELGYKQEYDLVEALRRTINWYKKENG